MLSYIYLSFSLYTTGSDLIVWIREKLGIEDPDEASHLGTLVCQYGYIFPVSDGTKSWTIKEDGTLYRFQSPYFWPSQYSWDPDNTDYCKYKVISLPL